MEPKQNPQSPQRPPLPGARQVGIRLSFPTVQPALTYAVLALISLIFLYVNTLDPYQQDLFLRNWAKINDRILFDGEYYRLLTSMFLHFSPMHIFFNGYALYLFGREVEKLFGHARFALIYFLGGLTGSVASLLYNNSPSIGASGAIFALFSAMGVYFYHHRHLYGQMARQWLYQMAVLAAINLMFGFLPNTNIDNAGHIGGLLGGLLLAWFICPQFQIQPDSMESGNVRIVDTNTPSKWMLVPALFAVGIIASVAYAVTVLA